MVKIGDVCFIRHPSCCHIEQHHITVNKNISNLFSFSEERCLACNPVETYENILDNFCRADFGTYINRLIQFASLQNETLGCLVLLILFCWGIRCSGVWLASPFFYWCFNNVVASSLHGSKCPRRTALDRWGIRSRCSEEVMVSAVPYPRTDALSTSLPKL
jgi:hypothetical protein